MYYGIRPGDPEDESDFYHPFYKDLDETPEEKVKGLLVNRLMQCYS